MLKGIIIRLIFSNAIIPAPLQSFVEQHVPNDWHKLVKTELNSLLMASASVPTVNTCCDKGCFPRIIAKADGQLSALAIILGKHPLSPNAKVTSLVV